MNLYFLLEDSESFYRVLPSWIQSILPEYRQISSLREFQKNDVSFLLETGRGYPQIKNRLDETLQTIEENFFPLDYIVVCWDTDARDEVEIERDCADFEAIFVAHPVNVQHRLFAINRCFETWLLGNRAAYPTDDKIASFLSYSQFYNVAVNDPEKMLSPTGRRVSAYHLHYLQEMLRRSCHRNYSKGSPGFAKTFEYFQELQSRINETSDLQTFAEFFNFLQNCKS